MKQLDPRIKIFRDIYKNKLYNSMTFYETNFFVPRTLEKKNKKISESKVIYYTLTNFFLILRNFLILFSTMFFCFYYFSDFANDVNSWWLLFYYLQGVIGLVVILNIIFYIKIFIETLLEFRVYLKNSSVVREKSSKKNTF